MSGEFNLDLEELSMYELRYIDEEFDAEPRENFLCNYMAQFILKNDIHGARHLWRRSSSASKEFPQYKFIWDVGKSIWNENISEAISKLTAFDGNQQLKSSVINDILVKLRNDQLRRIAKVYSRISLSKLSAMIGIADTDALIEIQSLGWSFNGDFITPNSSFAIPQSASFNRGKETELMESLIHYTSILEVRQQS